MILLTIPYKAPSINHVYGQHGFTKFIKPEGKKIRQQIEDLIKALNIDATEYNNKKLKVCVSIFEDWHTKDGTVKQKDIANREKFLIDSVFNALGIDDKFIFEHKME